MIMICLIDASYKAVLIFRKPSPVFIMRYYASTVLAVIVCLSVRPSCQYFIKMVTCMIMQQCHMIAQEL